MASAKDIFEPQLFGANLFAAGIFRGVGVPAVVKFPAGGALIRAGHVGRLTRFGPAGDLARVGPTGRIRRAQ